MIRHCAVVVFIAIVTASSALAEAPRLVCYFPSWANYRPDEGKYTVDNIDPSLCTHLVYAFAKLDGASYTIQPYDTYLDVTSNYYQRFTALKMQNSKLITMIAIGGDRDSTESDKYSRLVTSSANIAKFVNSVTAFLEQYKFDGLDFDWEFPSTPSDKDGFANLLRALQSAFTSNGFYLSVAVPTSATKINQGFDVVAMASAVDFVNLMAYDMHGSWTPSEADHHAPLYRRAWELENNTNNIDYSVDYWIGKGMPAEKINMGVPLYGRSWTLATMASVDPEPPAEAVGPGVIGDWTDQTGLLGYNEICNAVKNYGWEVVSDSDLLNGPYAVSPIAPKTWVGFDDAEMAVIKANYAISKQLGGTMVWDMSTDDFSNMCGKGRNPLMSAISRKMGVGSANPSGRFVCYFPNWTVYRKGAGRFSFSDVDPTLCTDYVYAFATLDGTSFEIKPFDPQVDITDEGYKKFVQMRTKNPKIKTWIAIGGWDDSKGDKYSRLVSNPTNIDTFVRSVVSFLKTHGFDGLDIDWEFPTSGSDKLGLAALLRSLRVAFSEDSYKISVAISVNPTTIDSGYDIVALNETADYVNLMAYDMHGSWELRADHHAPLYRRPWDAGVNENNINYTVMHLLESGLAKEKLNLGIPLYGQSFELKSLSTTVDPRPPAKASGIGIPGTFTNLTGYLGYNEICKSVKTNGWLVSHDPELLNGPYASSPIAPFTWVGYDGPEMAAHKASYVLNKKLGGVMVWDMSTDDFKAACSNQRNPILMAIAQTLNGRAPTTLSTTPSQIVTTTTPSPNITSSRAPSTRVTMTRFTTPTTEPVTRKAKPTVKPNDAPSYKKHSNFLIVTACVFSYYFL